MLSACFKGVHQSRTLAIRNEIAQKEPPAYLELHWLLNSVKTSTFSPRHFPNKMWDTMERYAAGEAALDAREKTCPICGKSYWGANTCCL